MGQTILPPHLPSLALPPLAMLPRLRARLGRLVSLCRLVEVRGHWVLGIPEDSGHGKRDGTIIGRLRRVRCRRHGWEIE
jgi:hypothetical protein